VMLTAGENLLPVSGAVLSVSFKEEDKLPVTMGMTAAAFTNVTGAKATAEVKMVSNLIGGQSTGNISAQAMNQSGANVNFLASATAKNGVANPVMVSSQTVGNAAQ